MQPIEIELDTMFPDLAFKDIKLRKGKNRRYYITMKSKYNFCTMKSKITKNNKKHQQVKIVKGVENCESLLLCS